MQSCKFSLQRCNFAHVTNMLLRSCCTVRYKVTELNVNKFCFIIIHKASHLCVFSFIIPLSWFLSHLTFQVIELQEFLSIIIIRLRKNTPENDGTIPKLPPRKKIRLIFPVNAPSIPSKFEK